MLPSHYWTRSAAMEKSGGNEMELRDTYIFLLGLEFLDARVRGVRFAVALIALLESCQHRRSS